MLTAATGAALSVDTGNLVNLGDVELGCEPKLVITSS